LYSAILTFRSRLRQPALLKTLILFPFTAVKSETCIQGWPLIQVLYECWQFITVTLLGCCSLQY